MKKKFFGLPKMKTVRELPGRYLSLSAIREA